MKLEELKVGDAVHCPIEEMANELLAGLKAIGYQWNGGYDLVEDENEYDTYDCGTCYNIEDDKKVTYGDFEFFMKHVEYTVIEFSELSIEPSDVDDHDVIKDEPSDADSSDIIKGEPYSLSELYGGATV